ncbi:PQQ-binding-like beta-propeller repeat protein [Salipiger mucosus]|uniref:PQQ-like beta-propeller repeat protein n=1 Tax=Salipiger mucosus TaxID=263378 RepID=UPI00037C5B60
MRITTISAGLVGLTILAACGEREVILPGERLGTREVLQDAALSDAPTPPNTARAIALSATRGNADWAQSPVSEFARVDHPALNGALSRVFSVELGEGDTRRKRLNVDPVVSGGRIFAMDADHTLSSFSTSGELLWQKSMVPLRDAAYQAQGGGLAAADGRLYVASGFGRLAALDPATGAEIWTQKLGGTATGAPTAFGGLVYVTSADSRGWAIEADSGRIRWQLETPDNINNVAGAPAPAVSDEYAIFAFGSGAVQGAFRQGGLRVWNADVVGKRSGYAISTVDDITGDPLIDGDRVYVGNHSGRMVALQLQNGERLWTADLGARGPVWPAGDSVFLVSDRNELVRLDAATGEQVWAVDLPGYEPVRRPQKRRDSAYAHHGPVLAGGRLIVASSDGALRSFNPENGALLSAVEIPGGATTRPAIANGVLYLATGDGRLVAYR